MGDSPVNYNTNTLKADDCIITQVHLKNATYNTFHIGSITIHNPTVGMIAHELYQAIHNRPRIEHKNILYKKKEV
jgi:hypothetical protein